MSNNNYEQTVFYFHNEYKGLILEIIEWQKMSGLPIKKFFNTSGQLYKAMGLKDKLPEMSFEDAVKLLAQDGMLVKRPIAVDGDTVLVGFKEGEWERLK